MEKRLTVVQIVPSLESSNQAGNAIEIARELRRAGHRAVLVSAGGRLEVDLQRCGAEHIRWPLARKSPWSVRWVGRLRYLLRTLEADVVHAHARMPAWISWLAWRGMDAQTRPRFVTSVHAPYKAGRYSAVMSRGERAIVLSQWLRDYLLEHFPKTDPARLALIPRGIDREIWRHGFQPPFYWQQDFLKAWPQTEGRQILTLPGPLGSGTAKKPFIRLIAALTRAGMPAHGLIAGSATDGGTFEECRREIVALGIGGNISLLGPRADLREIMAISDIVLSLSTDPVAFDRTALEALSLGRPVIAYDHSGHAEVMSRIFPEGLVATGNADALLQRARAFLTQRPQVTAEHDYPLQRTLGDTLTLYATLARARSAAAG